jgi:hypothetical protein
MCTEKLANKSFFASSQSKISGLLSLDLAATAGLVAAHKTLNRVRIKPRANRRDSRSVMAQPLTMNRPPPGPQSAFGLRPQNQDVGQGVIGHRPIE